MRKREDDSECDEIKKKGRTANASVCAKEIKD